jgi:hypothetical protein
MIEPLDTDYLIIGAGASAMAFADEIVSQSKSAQIIMVDRRAAPGGHWNNAYSFVTLHQPAAFYGVNSERLEKGPEDFASRDMIVAYYARVMNKLCATGRVQFFGECDYLGQGRFKSLNADGREYHVTPRLRTVDATYTNVSVPSTRPPPYAVAEGMHAVPINALADLDRTWSRYVVIGAGKTGMDALLRLLEMGTDPDQITWVVSHDVWLINRDVMKLDIFAPVFTKQLEQTCLATDVDDYFRRFEEAGWFMRVDPSVPTVRFRCASVTPDELKALRRIKDVVRLGRVTHIDATEIVLDRGRVPTGPDVLHVDCSADGLARRPARPVFDGDHITLQPVTFCQPVMSAAMLGNIEMLPIDDDRKNKMSHPTPHPMVPHDYFVTVIAMADNLIAWFPMQLSWLLRNRLSMFHHVSLWGKIRFAFGMLRWFRGSIRAANRFVRDLEEADRVH